MSGLHPLDDFSKLDIRGGPDWLQAMLGRICYFLGRGETIHYRLYQQDGTMQPMACSNTQSNRLFVSWVQKFDRYSSILPRRDGLPASSQTAPGPVVEH